MKIKANKVAKYVLLPGIIPMIRGLFSTGFGHVAYYMAQIYGGARLLPANHPYLNIQNLGRFGMSSVIVEGYKNLRFTRNNIDQIFIFFLLVFGLVLLIGQFAILGFAIFTQGALAGGLSYSDFFVTADPTNDIAHILVDRVFGIPDMFNSCVAQGIPCLNSTIAEPSFPFPYHLALHDMLAFYSVGLCVIGVIIFLYYIVTIVVETAQTGTPFGRRYNSVWAPIRMVVALALLVPIAYGLNGAQLLTLHVAKWGSAFATNGWTRFAETLVDASVSPAGVGAQTLVGTPQKPNPESLFQFFTVAAVCKKAYEMREDIEIDAYLVKNTSPPGNYSLLTANTWAQARDFYQNGDIIVVFGEYHTKHTTEKGNVKPYCGELVLPQVALTQPGSVSIQTSYYEGFIRRFWENASTGSPSLGTAPNLPAPSNEPQDFFFVAADRIIEKALPSQNNADALYPNDAGRNALLNRWTIDLGGYITVAVTDQVGDGDWMYDLADYGWGGAGIWYNRIAELNGALIAGIGSIPQVRKWPLVMEAIAEEKAKKDKNVSNENRYLPHLSDESAVQLPSGMSAEIATVLASAYAIWNTGNAQEASATGEAVPMTYSKNAFIDFVKHIFGLKGLYNMRENTDTHPLAQLVMIGKYLLDASVIALAGTAGSSVLAIILGATDIPPELAKAFGTMLKTVGMMTLSLGFVLYYVVPFLPFMYFFFQVGGWIKALFEAMVGLPLWALAHIRIDGDGLPGQAAVNGYFLIFEIFLRPILTVFGLIAGISIFAAQVQVLNGIFDLVVSNLTGFDTEGAIAAAGAPAPGGGGVAGLNGAATHNLSSVLLGTFDYATNFVNQLFYTVIYTMIVYMMGMASFKLVYLIPDNMLRWMGSSVDGFGEIAKSDPGNIVGQTYSSSTIITGQVSGALSGLMARR